ncbi:MAG: hypothetical protein GY742_08625 [Hyphomicrobiales bacterium]|nr:hypothetical protein [Hyphomicrobiales bacterium]
MKYEPFDAPYRSTRPGAEPSAMLAASGKLRNNADGLISGTLFTMETVENMW